MLDRLTTFRQAGRTQERKLKIPVTYIGTSSSLPPRITAAIPSATLTASLEPPVLQTGTFSDFGLTPSAALTLPGRCSSALRAGQALSA